VLYLFYDLETTKNTSYSDKATVAVVSLVRVQLFSSKCEGARCGKRKHTFWDDPVSDMLAYLCEPRPWVKKIVAIAHNAKAFDLHFILKRAILLKWQPELIIKELKIM
jgi:hypothetical protein